MIRHFALARLLLAVLIALCLSMISAARGPASPPVITLMTWNIYYGGGGSLDFDLGNIFENVKDTNFVERAARIARVIDQKRPNVLCLQEVAHWRTEDLLGDEHDDIDFLAILQSRLLALGLRYDVAGAVETIDFEAFGDVDGDLLRIHWQERIVMLVRRSANIEVGVVRTRHYDDIESVPTPVGDLDFNRGWIAADITFKGVKARYVCTHLEAISNPTRAAQASQLMDWLSETNLPVVVMGDMNAQPGSDVYDHFISSGYDDAWLADHDALDGPTCCQTGHLRNQQSALAYRIDQMFLKGALTPISTARVGQRQADKTPSGMWPSDHAGVVMKVRLD